MTAVRTDRERRRQRVRDLIATHVVTSQTELVALLETEGITATQATVSRDLEELEIAKVRGADGQVSYALPESGGLPQILRQFAIAIEASGNLAVVRTPPGAASAVGSAVDGADLPAVLATVQGDDTLLIVAVEGASGREIADHLLSLKQPRTVIHVEQGTHTA